MTNLYICNYCDIVSNFSLGYCTNCNEYDGILPLGDMVRDSIVACECDLPMCPVCDVDFYYDMARDDEALGFVPEYEDEEYIDYYAEASLFGWDS